MTFQKLFDKFYHATDVYVSFKMEENYFRTMPVNISFFAGSTHITMKEHFPNFLDK